MAKNTEAEDLLTSIEQQARYVAEQRLELERRKALAKEQREELDGAQQELEKLCLVRDEKNPLLDGAGE